MYTDVKIYVNMIADMCTCICVYTYECKYIFMYIRTHND